MTAKTARLLVLAAGTSIESSTDLPPAPVLDSVPAPSTVVRLTVPERAGTAVRRVTGELLTDPGRLLHAMWTSNPESMADHFAYVRSRAWVPQEMTGKAERAVTIAGLLYHVLIGWLLISAAKLLGWAAPRPLRLLCLAVPVVTVLLVLGIL